MADRQMLNHISLDQYKEGEGWEKERKTCDTKEKAHCSRSGVICKQVYHTSAKNPSPLNSKPSSGLINVKAVSLKTSPLFNKPRATVELGKLDCSGMMAIL